MSTPQNLIMITLDCVRPDHLGCYGYKGVDTPSTDQLAKEGVLFEQTICQAPNTWISHASIFTGCYPNKHGIRNNYDRLSSNVVTLAEELKEAGYKTAGFPAHTLVGSARGFDRGFEYFNEDEEDFKFKSDTKGARYNRDWDSTFNKISSWIKNNMSSNFFLWIHYMGTHEGPTGNLFLPDEYKKRYSAFGQFYDGKISYADKVCVLQLVNLLKEMNLYKNTAIVIFSDHGEELTEDRAVHNDNLFDNTMRIPWIIRAPNKVFSGKRIKNITGSVDFMPTILDILGLWENRNKELSQLINGKTLLPLISNGEGTTILDRFIYMENLSKGFIGIRSEKWKLILKNSDNSTSNNRNSRFKRFGERLSKLKCLKGMIRPNLHVTRKFLTTENVYGLYDLENDPVEHDDVSKENPDILQNMLEVIGGIINDDDAQVERDAMSKEEQEEIEKTLKNLGYL